MIYLNLFLTFLKIGVFSFGGGYAMLSLISQEVVIKNKWLTMGQFTDIVAISQVTPGPIAVNAATYVGYTATNSVLGAIMATLGVIFPSIVIMLILMKLVARYKHLDFVDYAFKGLRIVVIGLMLGAAFLLMNKENLIDYKSYIILLLAIITSIKFKIGPIPTVFTSAVIGIILYS